MSQENQDPNIDGQKPNDGQPAKVALPTTIEELEALLDARTDEKLKGIKEKLDKAYAERDEAKGKVQEFTKKERDAEIKRLEEEGKHREAYELQMKEMREQLEALANQNTALSRDNLLTAALAGLPFKNVKAREMAKQEITAELVRNEQGQWVHKSGVSIADFVKAYHDDADHDFMFKQKQSSGMGSGATKPASTGTPKKISEMTQAEVMKLAAEGKLPNQR